MNISKNDLESYMQNKVKLLEKKSLLKETSLINVNQLRIKRDILQFNFNKNLKNKYKFQKDIRKKVIERIIYFKLDNNKENSNSNQVKLKKKCEKKTFLCTELEGTKESFILFISPNYLEKIIESTLNKSSTFNLNKFRHELENRKIHFNLNLNVVRKIEFPNKLNKFNIEHKTLLSPLIPIKSDNYLLNLCENTDTFYSHRLLDHINYFNHSSFKIIHDNKENVKFHKKSINNYLTSKIPNLNILSKPKRIYFNPSNRINYEYQITTDFKETSFFDESLITKIFNGVYNIENLPIKRPQYLKLLENNIENKRDDIVINKITFSSLKEIDFKKLCKIKQENTYYTTDVDPNEYNHRKRTSRELNVLPQNQKRAKVQSGKEVSSLETNKIRLYVNSDFIVSNSKNGTFNNDFINIIKSIISKFEVIIFDQHYLIGMDVIINKKYGALILSPESFIEDLIGNHKENKYIKVIEILNKNSLRFELIFLIFTKDSNIVINNLRDLIKRKLPNFNKVCFKIFHNIHELASFLIDFTKDSNSNELVEFNYQILYRAQNLILSSNFLNLIHFIYMFHYLYKNSKVSDEELFQLLNVENKVYKKEVEIISKKITEICKSKVKRLDNSPLIYLRINDKESIYDELKRIVKAFPENKRFETKLKSKEKNISKTYKLKAK